MNDLPRRLTIRYTILYAVALAALSACGTPIPQIPVQGELAGWRIQTTVDSSIAKYYLEHYLKGERIDPSLDDEIRHADPRLNATTLNREDLERLSEQFSLDFATLVFAKLLSDQPRNRRWQDAYFTEFRALRSVVGTGSFGVSPGASAYDILFAPGWLYQTDPWTGADFKRQRDILSGMGLRTILIETEESGAVQRNAEIIAEQIARRRDSGRRIILVSTSKSGAEVALALGRLLRPDQTLHVAAWVNVGGVLQGSRLADRATGWPIGWGVRLYFWWKCFDYAGLASMTTDIRRPLYRQLAFPEHLVIVNYVAVPLSGDISPGVRSRYEMLRPYGPNDGLTLLVDQILPNSVTILAPGLDHLFRDPEIGLKTVAIFRVVVKYLERASESKTDDT